MDKYDYKYFEVIDKENYGWMIHTKPAVVCIPMIEEKGEKRLGLARIFRIPIDRESWEFPGGEVDGIEIPEEAAKRELFEETGHQSFTATKIGEFYPAPGKMDFPHNVILCTDIKKASDDFIYPESEKISAFLFFSVDEINSLILKGEIVSGATISALQIFNITRV